MTRTRRLTAAGVVLAGLLLPAGCVSLPESGPVTSTKPQGQARDQVPEDIVPLPPRPGESQPQTVQGFLDAMRAYPVNTAVAREYLTSDYSSEWKPGLETITYDTTSAPRGEPGHLLVDLSSPSHLDTLGHWQGPLQVGHRTLKFTLVKEDGEWRISKARDALVVPQGWFLPRFSQASIYFLDPTASILVPEPVFVPRGEQLATDLVRGLLAGPGAGPLRTYFPGGLTPPLSVPVSKAGVADVVIGGDVSMPTQDAIEKITAQLVWTLKQDPAIKEVTLSLGGHQIELSGGRTQVGVEGSPTYDPVGFGTSARLFGISDGKVVSGVTPATLSPVPGPFGLTSYGIRSLSVDLAADKAVGVTANGRSLLVAPLVREPLTSGAVGGGAVRHLLDDATDLLRPAWDYSGRLWIVDRTTTGARVSYIGRGGAQTLTVPGVTGLDVRRFLVSNDGSRLIALVHGKLADRVVVTRILHDQVGVVTGFNDRRTIATSRGSDRIQDIGWSSPTTLLLLSRLTDTAQVRTISVDGAPTGSDGLNATVFHAGARLVTSPAGSSDTRFYALTSDGLIDLTGTDNSVVRGAPDLRGLWYVG